MAAKWLTVLCFVAAAGVALGSKQRLKVTTLLTEPFARYKSLTALPHELEGYIIDLLHEMESLPEMEQAGITFHVTPVDDGKYGSYDFATNKWNGMIKKLKDDDASLAAAPLTVNEKRVEEVKFLEPPFMTFDLAMLMRKRHHKSSGIQAISDLNKQQTKYVYGVVHGGSTYNHFQGSSDIYTFGQLRAAERKGTLPRTVAEGVQRVRESTDSHPYVFIGEQYMLEYHASQKPCDLVVVKGEATVMEGEYHLAVKKDHEPSFQSTVNKLEAALTELNDSGRLEPLYKKWWKDRSQCNRAPSSTVMTSGTVILVPILLAILMRVSGE